ncbi:hypothetical protein J6590_107516, partial [Homalodisca vitripennis]
MVELKIYKRPKDLNQSSSSSESDSDLVYDSDADPEYLPKTTDPIAEGLRKYLKLQSTRPVLQKKFDDESRPTPMTGNIVIRPTQIENDIALPNALSYPEVTLHEANGDVADPEINIITIAVTPETEPLRKKPRKRWSKPHPETWKVN